MADIYEFGLRASVHERDQLVTLYFSIHGDEELTTVWPEMTKEQELRLLLVMLICVEERMGFSLKTRVRDLRRALEWRLKLIEKESPGTDELPF